MPQSVFPAIPPVPFPGEPHLAGAPLARIAAEESRT